MEGGEEGTESKLGGQDWNYDWNLGGGNWCCVSAQGHWPRRLRQAPPAPCSGQTIQILLPKQLDQNLGTKHFGPLSIYNLKETDSQT